MATCNINELLEAGRCFSCLGGGLSAIARLALIGQYLEASGGTLGTPSALLNAGRCFTCLTPGQQRIVEVQLLCNIFHLDNSEPVGECDQDTLLHDGRCWTCLTPGQGDLVYLQLWCEIVTGEDEGATCEPDELLELGKCYACLNGGQQDIIRLQLLCQIQQALGGSSCDTDVLLEQGKCLACLTPGELDAIELQLLCEIQSGGGGCTVPNAPSDLVVSWVSTTELDVNWTDNSSDETGFEIQRGTDGISFPFTDTVGAGVTVYHDTGLTPDTQYFYRVRAFNACGDSAFSNTDSEATTTVPFGSLLIWYRPDSLTETPGDPVLQWDDESGNANHAVTSPFAGTDAQRATLTINGHNGVEMNNILLPGNMVSTSNCWSGTTSRSFYVAYAITDPNSFGAFDCGSSQFYDGSIAGQITNGVNNASFITQERPTDGCPGFCPFFTGWANDIAMNQGQTFLDARLISVTYNNSTPLISAFFNGTAAGTSGTGLNTTAAVFRMGLDDTGGSNLPCVILEVLAYNELHTTATRQGIEAYLKTKYAIP